MFQRSGVFVALELLAIIFGMIFVYFGVRSMTISEPTDPELQAGANHFSIPGHHLEVAIGQVAFGGFLIGYPIIVDHRGSKNRLSHRKFNTEK